MVTMAAVVVYLLPFALLLASAAADSVSCSPGYLVLPDRRGGGYFCSQDPCLSPSICGPGNTCTTAQVYLGGPSLLSNCTQCNPPYVALATNYGGFVQIYCYIPGQDPCNPNPCNGGTCLYVQDSNVFPQKPLTGQQNTPVAASCNCTGTGNTGAFCTRPVPSTPAVVTSTVGSVTGPIAAPDYTESCGVAAVGCVYKDGAHYLCCSRFCGPYGPDGNTPLCSGLTFIPPDNSFPPKGPAFPLLPPPTTDQGVCGTAVATIFPNRCYYENEGPGGRYVCCGARGCFGYNNGVPRCNGDGYAPPNGGLSPGTPPTTPSTPPASPTPPTPPSGDQGVCGTGAARDFPLRCWFNSDPQGRYVCCDNAGCNGFAPPDFLFPRCQQNGYAPPGYGVGAPPTTPATPPTTPATPTPPSAPSGGDQGICGSGAARDFPLRCWFNSDPQGRYVCCDNDGCNGFAPPDNLFPRCQKNGYAPPGYGV